MDELAVRENLKSLAQHALGHRRCSVGNVFEVREIEVPHRGVVGEHVEHGRHIYGVCDLLLLHGVQAVVGIEARDKDVSPAAGSDTEGPAAVGKVEHRGGMYPGHGVVEVEACDRVHRVPHQVVVAEHHAPGLAGRAAGVEQGGERVTPGAGVGDRRCRYELLVGPHARRWRIVVEVEHHLDCRQLPGQRNGMRLHGAVNEQHARPGIFENVPDLGRCQPGVHRRHDGAQPRDGVHQLEVMVAIECQDGDPITGLHAGFVKSTGDPRDAVGRLRPDAPPVSEHRGLFPRPDLRCTPQPLGQIHCTPHLRCAHRNEGVTITGLFFGGLRQGCLRVAVSWAEW